MINISLLRNASGAVIEESTIGQPRALIERTTITIDLKPGATHVPVAEDGFFVGASVTIGTEEAVVASIATGSISLMQPLVSSNASGSVIRQSPIFQNLTVNSKLTVKPHSSNPAFLIRVRGSLTVSAGGEIESQLPADLPHTSGAQACFSAGEGVTLAGLIRAGSHVTTVFEGTEIAASGSFTGPGGVSLRSTVTNVTFSANVATLSGLSISAAGNVQAGAIVIGDVLVIQDVRGNVTTGSIETLDDDPFIAIQRISGAVSTGDLIVSGPAGFVAVGDITGPVAIGSIAAPEFISLNRCRSDLVAKNATVTALEGFIGLADIDGSVCTSNLCASVAGGFVSIRNIRQNFTNTTILAGHSTDPLNEGFVAVNNIGGSFHSERIYTIGNDTFTSIRTVGDSITCSSVSAVGDAAFIDIRDVNTNVFIGTLDVGLNSGDIGGQIFVTRVQEAFVTGDITARGQSAFIMLSSIFGEFIVGSIQCSTPNTEGLVSITDVGSTNDSLGVVIGKNLVSNGNIIVSNIIGNFMVHGRFLATRQTKLAAITGSLLLNFARELHFDRNGTFENLLASKATIIITHGWRTEAPPAFADGRPLDWPIAMQHSILSKVGDTPFQIFTFSWEGAHTGINPHKSRAHAESAGRALGHLLFDFLGPEYTNNIQFIGHSHGSMVNAFAAQAVTANGITVRQFTILDSPFGLLGNDIVDFKRLLPRDKVVWVDNYYGDRPFPLFVANSSFGICIPGAYNAETHGGHSDVVAQYQTSIDTPGQDRFFYSIAGGGFERRPDDGRFWDPGAISSSGCSFPNRFTRLLQLPFTGGGNIWQAVNCILNGGSALCAEHSPALLFTDYTIPTNATHVSFDFKWIRTNALSAGDYLTLEFGDELLFEIEADVFEGTNFWTSGLINIERLAGQSNLLKFTLNSVGQPDSEIHLDNLTLFAATSVIPIVMQIESSPSIVNLSWKGGVPPYVLERTTSLPAVWEPISTNAGMSMVLPASGSTTFFRVRGQ